MPQHLKKFKIECKKSIKLLKPNKKVSANIVINENDFEYSYEDQECIVDANDLQSEDVVLEIIIECMFSQ